MINKKEFEKLKEEFANNYSYDLHEKVETFRQNVHFTFDWDKFYLYTSEDNSRSVGAYYFHTIENFYIDDDFYLDDFNSLMIKWLKDKDLSKLYDYYSENIDIELFNNLNIQDLSQIVENEINNQIEYYWDNVEIDDYDIISKLFDDKNFILFFESLEKRAYIDYLSNSWEYDYVREIIENLDYDEVVKLISESY